jgi:hypothetical protein
VSERGGEREGGREREEERGVRTECSGRNAQDGMLSGLPPCAGQS